MSSSDTYEFNKSQMDQTMDHETPYTRKQYNYINDINNGNYSVGGQTLVQFDGSSIFNSGHFIDPSGMYLTIPIVRVCAFASNTLGALVQPTVESATVGNEWICTLKAGFWNLLQSHEIVVDGKTVVQQTPNINYYNNFKLLSQMSRNDLDEIGQTLGIGALDNERSLKYAGLASTLRAGGNGIKNNDIFPISSTAGDLGVATPGMQPTPSSFGTQTFNDGLYVRSVPSASNSVLVPTALGINNIYASSTSSGATATTDGDLSLMSVTNMNNEFKSNFQILATNYLVWYDTAIIRLKDVSSFFDKCPLLQNMNVLLRLYLNTGVCGIGYNKATGDMNMSGANTTFTNTCPFIINNLAKVLAPATTTNLVAGLFIQKAVTTSMLGVDLGTSKASHTMPTCRLYFPMIQLKTDNLTSYVNNNRAKKILYKNVLYQNLANIIKGGMYSQLVQSGVSRISGVLLIPYMSAQTHGKLTSSPVIDVAFHPALSPFDTAPITTPMSLTQLNVAIGGVNELMNFYNYTYENFVQQVSNYDKINGSDLGLTCGLINQSRWELAYRYYWIDCSRYSDAIQNVPRNVTVTFMNNTLQTIDVSCYVEYISESTINVIDGRIL